MTTFHHPIARCARCHRFLWAEERMTFTGLLAYCPECAPRCRRRRVRPAMVAPTAAPFHPLAHESARFFIGLFGVALGLFGAATLLTLLWLR